MTVAVVVVLAVAFALAALRWLRVAQREHYLPGSCTRIDALWLRVRRPNLLVAAASVLLAAVTLVAAFADDVPDEVAAIAAILAAIGAAAMPLHMSLRGRTSRLVPTRRLLTLAGALVVVAVAVAVALAVATGVVATAVWVVLAVPLLVDLAAWLVQPWEALLAGRHRHRAAARLAQVKPRVVAITGSYGKTSTKGHVRDLLAGSVDVMASPESWNNRAGLARAINEHLQPTTEVFVAEMGTYGPGEIREMCSWIPPEVAMITSIGPVHLERMGTLERIVEAKAEILEDARVAVLGVDSDLLAALADAREASGQEVWRCGTRADRAVDVLVSESADGELTVTARGEVVGTVPGAGLHAGNVACAVAAVLALGVAPRVVAGRLARLAPAAHRAEVQQTDGGVTVIDDTFNSNPAGARAALDRLLQSVPDGRRVVVTPGMVELGKEQDPRNRELAAAVRDAHATLVVVGWTNRRALLGGAGESAEVVAVDSRADALSWVRANVGAGDGVLWENDLPDQYP